MTGGGCVIPDFGVLQLARSRARALDFDVPKKAKIIIMGVTLSALGRTTT